MPQHGRLESLGRRPALGDRRWRVQRRPDAARGGVFPQRDGLGRRVGWDPASGKPSPASVVLAGHLLGGGLAGLVGSIYDANAVLFDNMPFERAAENLHHIGNAQVGSADPASVQERHAARAFFNGAAPL